MSNSAEIATASRANSIVRIEHHELRKQCTEQTVRIDELPETVADQLAVIDVLRKNTQWINATEDAIEAITEMLDPLPEPEPKEREDAE